MSPEAITPENIEGVREEARVSGIDSWAGLFSELAGTAPATDLAELLAKTAKTPGPIDLSRPSSEADSTH